jgi:hypothetical protein
VTEETEKPKFSQRKQALAGVAFGIVWVAVFTSFGLEAYDWPTLFSVIAIGFAFYMNWKLHHKLWFWISILCWSFLHFLFVGWFAASFGHLGHVYGRGVLGVAIADAAIITGIIRFPSWFVSSMKWFWSDNTDTKTEVQ